MFEILCRRNIFLLFLMIHILCIGCSTTYYGIVKDARTNLPIEGVTVEGRYFYNKKFVPSLDGFFIKETKSVKAETDSNGKFKLTTPRRASYLFIYKQGYNACSFKLYENKPGGRCERWDPKEEIVIKLKRWGSENSE